MCRRHYSSSDDLIWCLKGLVSSASNRALLQQMASGRSFMYMINRRDPRILPWGTLDITRRRSEWKLLIDMNCYLYYCIWQNFQGGKLSDLQWEKAIRSKTFTVAFLYTYIADQKGHDSQEKILNWVKSHKSFPLGSFAAYSVLTY